MVNGGNHIELEFGDGARYMMHASWLRDAGAVFAGRHTACNYGPLERTHTSNCGASLLAKYNCGQTEMFDSAWLRAAAPTVGRLLGSGKALGDAPNCPARRTPWKAGFKLPVFDADALRCDEGVREFLKVLASDGVARIDNIGLPSGLGQHEAGVPLEKLAFRVLGMFNQHPVRTTTYAYLHKCPEIAKMGADYDQSNPLSMHTDHTVYQGTPGFVQWLYQAKGAVTSKVCDGLALSQHLKEQYPEEYELLTNVQVTHSSRNTLYTTEGKSRNVRDASSQPNAFELVHTHPIIRLGPGGDFVQVVQSETKRGISAIPFHKFDAFMKAYRLWMNLCESDQFITHFDWPEGSAVVTNNWRVLHGRANVRPDAERTLVTAYQTRALFENRLRYLERAASNQDRSHSLAVSPSSIFSSFVSK